MRDSHSNTVLAVAFIILIALLPTGCQSGNSSRPINIESDGGSGEFYSGEKNGIDYSDTSTSNEESSNDYTSQSSCPGAPPQRVRVGGNAVVSTISDRVIVRKNGSKSATEIARIYPGTYLEIIDGPQCDEVNGWTYWKIRTDNGLVGWVSEGGDDIDYYFISPIE